MLRSVLFLLTLLPAVAFGKEAAKGEMQVTAADRQHWAFQPLRTVAVPASPDPGWTRTEVDSFIRQAQAAKGLTPSPAADARTLIRRLYYDVIGLPPRPEEMQRWLEHLAKTPTAVAPLIEELLANPHYGERWARHWLDVARYADSNGMEGDDDRPTAYHFRDFVIRAFNDDMPCDQFMRWQLAGDELNPDNPQAIAATGFLVAGTSIILNVPMEEEKLRTRANELDDIVSTTGQAMLGLTLACARCHDHKYDPLPTRDYYRLMSIFNSGDRKEVPLASAAEVASQAKAMTEWKQQFDSATQARSAWLKHPRPALAEQLRTTRISQLPISDEEKQLLTSKPDEPKTKELAQRFKKQLQAEDPAAIKALLVAEQAHWQELEERVQKLNANKPSALPKTFAFADFAAEPRESWLFERGDFMARNQKVNMGFLTVLQQNKPAEAYWQSARASILHPGSTQQRRALADWMTDLDDGAGRLLARVFVNRVWQHHFGEGLVRSVSDFGTRGEKPSHPELLEWLTSYFISHGWSLKDLHRIILSSATYQQAAGFDEKKAAIDPENRLLWQRRPLRVEAEILRDSMLAVAGTLNPTMFGPSFKPPIPSEALQARNVKQPYPKDAQDTAETRRRTIYLFHKRVVQYPLMQAFDAPDAQQSCGRRMNTTVAPQALAMLNDPFVRLRAEELATQLQSTPDNTVENKVQLAFQRCFNRAPTPAELTAATGFIGTQTTSRQARDVSQTAASMELLALTDFCQSLFGLNEFIYID